MAIDDGYTTEDFKIYCTTWGNPDDHNFRIDLIDPWVDGYMPQTYVEIWGQTYIEDLENWIEVGTEEYESLGATKPIHHMTATENNIMTGDELNRFMKSAGPEFSIWRLPGGGTPDAIWEDWNQVEWDYEFCESTSTKDVKPKLSRVYPSISSGPLSIESSSTIEDINIIDVYGRAYPYKDQTKTLVNLPSGQYFIHILHENQQLDIHKIIKI